MQRLQKLFQSIFTVLIVTVLASCGNIPPAAATEPEAATPPVSDASTAPAQNAQDAASRDTYIVQPGDLLTISVWKEKDLQSELSVRPDGGINFPLIGEVIVAGKTIEQIQKDIATRLTKYVPDPVVTATVKESRGNRIYVVGKVNKPGEFASTRTIDVMQALSMAGGPNPFASVNKIKILRRVNGEQKTFLFKYSQVEKGKNLEQNIILQGGDIVVVP